MPFDQIAPAYGALWTDTPRGRSQRTAVWKHIDGLFHPGDALLDLGCGTGDDAVHLREHGAGVLGIDSSEMMVRIAHSRGVNARQLAIENLELLEGRFDGALSNFGALNCVADLGSAVQQMARLLAPSAPLAICVMGRLCWAETLHALIALDWSLASRRWSGRARWRGMTIYYRSARHMVKLFRPYFQLEQRASIGNGDHQLFIFRRRVA
jgi:ubiquinone/menaquinone biosynthesis C-methylase UbiE